MQPPEERALFIVLAETPTVKKITKLALTSMFAKVKAATLDVIAKVKKLQEEFARLTAITLPGTMTPCNWGSTNGPAIARPALADTNPPKLATPASTSDAHESTPENVADVPISAPDSVVARWEFASTNNGKASACRDLA